MLIYAYQQNTKKRGFFKTKSNTPTLKREREREREKIEEVSRLTGGVMKEPMRNRLKALLYREYKIRWHRQTCHHVLKDQSLMFQFLPL